MTEMSDRRDDPERRLRTCENRIADIRIRRSGFRFRLTHAVPMQRRLLSPTPNPGTTRTPTCWSLPPTQRSS